eukprot:COSAG01_NODE_1996_length_8691_cov_10.109055_9_plen_127_part_00
MSVRQPPIHCTLVAEPWSRAPIGPVHDDHHVRVRVEIMGSQKYRIVGKSQSVLMMIHPIIFTRTRTLIRHGNAQWATAAIVLGMHSGQPLQLCCMVLGNVAPARSLMIRPAPLQCGVDRATAGHGA